MFKYDVAQKLINNHKKEPEIINIVVCFMEIIEVAIPTDSPLENLKSIGLCFSKNYVAININTISSVLMLPTTQIRSLLDKSAFKPLRNPKISPDFKDLQNQKWEFFEYGNNKDCQKLKSLLHKFKFFSHRTKQEVAKDEMPQFHSSFKYSFFTQFQLPGQITKQSQNPFALKTNWNDSEKIILIDNNRYIWPFNKRTPEIPDLKFQTNNFWPFMNRKD